MYFVSDYSSPIQMLWLEKCYATEKKDTITIKYKMYSQYVFKVYIVYKLKYLFVIVYQEFWNEYSALGISLQRHIEYQPTLNG